MMNATPDYPHKRALSVDLFCDRYSIGRTTVYSEIAAGRLQSIRIGRKRLIPTDAAESWFNSYAPQSNPIAA